MGFVGALQPQLKFFYLQDVMHWVLVWQGNCTLLVVCSILNYVHWAHLHS